MSVAPTRLAESSNGFRSGISSKSKNSCWQCDKKIEAMMKCSGCHQALYCSADCQKINWNVSHKKECHVLKEEYDSFNNNLNLIMNKVKLSKVEDEIAITSKRTKEFQRTLTKSASRDVNLVKLRAGAQIAYSRSVEIEQSLQRLKTELEFIQSKVNDLPKKD